MTGPFVQTYTGRAFHIFESGPDDVDIQDIAHGLSQICRFNGHCRAFYSVAQHAVMVSKLVPPELALTGLLHDAAEAYVGDMVRPIKQIMPYFCGIEEIVYRAIVKRFGLRVAMGTECGLPDTVKRADEIALAVEWRDLMQHPNGPWHWRDFDVEPSIIDMAPPIQPLASGPAKAVFLARYADLTGMQDLRI